MADLDLDELERIAKHDQYAGLAPSYAATTILALIQRVRALERVREVAQEFMLDLYADGGGDLDKLRVALAALKDASK
jgi:translation initiation factor RLI1